MADIINSIYEHLKIQTSLKLELEKAIDLTKKEYSVLNEKIRNFNQVKNNAEADVKSCIANLHSKGLTKELFPALDAARETLDEVLITCDTTDLEKDAEKLQNKLGTMMELLKRIS